MTQFVALATRMLQIFSLKMILKGLKRVGMTYSINKVLT